MVTKVAITLLLLCVSFDAYAKDTVVLLHGIARSSSSMEKIEHSFESNGYNVLNLNYPSTDQPIEDIVDTIHKDISKNTKDSERLHFITHSMGGLVTRAYITKYKPKKLGRVVMLSPPNKGSEVADFLKNNFLYQKFYGPAGQQLITDQTKLGNTLGTVDYELGIIAGTKSLDPISSIIIPDNDDGKVSLKRMKVEGMTGYKEVSATHTFIMQNEEAIQSALKFIQSGTFKTETREEMIERVLNLPPEPDKELNNSTVEGIDSNGNGVRDDIERANAFALYPATDKVAIMNELSRLDRESLLAIDDVDKLVKLHLESSGLVFCKVQHLNNDDRTALYKTPKLANTPERVNLMKRYNNISELHSIEYPSDSEMESMCNDFLSGL